MTKSPLRFVYFAGEPLGVPVLEKLLQAGLVPELVVCNPDRPQGRKHILSKPPVKELADKQGLTTLQPESYADKQAASLAPLVAGDFDLFVVVAYNHILPTWLLELPKRQTLNVHPSLLPLLRGPSPIRSAILNDQPEACGASVIVLDDKMDHGPIIAQAAWTADSSWPANGSELDAALADLSGDLLVETIPEWMADNLSLQSQDHSQATYTKKLSKADGELDIDPFCLPQGDEAYAALLKIRGLAGWPSTYFFYLGQRIKIIDADMVDGQLQLKRILPAGKKEVDFNVWQQQNRTV